MNKATSFPSSGKQAAALSMPRRAKIGAEHVPLVVDLDHTLVCGDVAIEAMVRAARRGIVALIVLVLVCLRGRATVKTFLARYAPVDPATLTYNKSVLTLIEGARRSGRPVILATAAHWRTARRVAAHLGLFDHIIASSSRANLKGTAKLEAIYALLGKEAFDYVGDSNADRPIWKVARIAFTVNVHTGTELEERLEPRRRTFRSLFKALRVHQWAKNALVFVPALTSGSIAEPGVFVATSAAAILMSMIASSIYLLNDMLDIDADRAHRTKWKRPLAHGDLTIPVALAASVILAGVGLVGGWMLGGPKLLVWLLGYMGLTTAYSLRLKAIMVGDAIVLASLYTIRILIGGVAIGVPISFWLLLFSVFLFLSLAYLKRYIEMRDATEMHRLLKGRGYVGGDLDVVMTSGISSGTVSILVLALFAHDPASLVHYREPSLLGFLCIPLIYWMNRIWMMARRGEVEGDPVAFAIKDRRSILIGAVMAGIILLALYGYPPGLKA